MKENKMQEVLVKCDEFSLDYFKDYCYINYVITYLGRKLAAIKKENRQPTEEEYREMDSTIDFFCAKIRNNKIKQQCVKYKQYIKQNLVDIKNRKKCEGGDLNPRTH